MNLLLRPYRGRSRRLPAAIVFAVGSLLLAVDASAQKPVAGAKPARAPMTTVELAKQLPGTIVTIVGERGLGSGVIVDPSGVIVTNLHVLRGETAVSVKLANGDIYDDVSVVDVDARKDLLILRIKAVGLAHATIGNSEAVNIGERVIAVGSPQGLERTVSDGIVSAVRDSGDGYRLFQTNAAASPGSSGGGLFNLRGELIGIVSAKLSSGENLNFSVPINYARGLIATTPRMTLTELAASYPAENAGGATVSANAEPSEEQKRRLEDLVKQSGLTFETMGPDAWSTVFEGDHAPRLTVGVYLVGELAVVQSVIQLNFNARLEHVKTLLEKSYAATIAKIALNPEGALSALTVIELRLLDGEALKLIAEAVARAADEAVGVIGSATVDSALPPLAAPSAGSVTGSVQLLNGHLTVRFDPSKWKSATDKVDEGDGYKLTHSSGTVAISLFAVRRQTPAESMPDIAIDNLREAGQTANEMRRGSRLVNGVTMTYVELTTTKEGLGGLRLLGHYYSDQQGTIQIIGAAHPDEFEKVRAHIDEIVAGFSVKR